MRKVTFTIDDLRLRAAPVVLAGALIMSALTSTIGSSILGQNVTAGLWAYASLLLYLAWSPRDRTVNVMAIPICVLALAARAEGFSQLVIQGRWNLGGTVLIWTSMLFVQLHYHISMARGPESGHDLNASG